MEQQNITHTDEQKALAVNKHPVRGNQPLIDDESLPEKLNHLSKQPHTKPWQNLHTTTLADPENTNNNC